LFRSNDAPTAGDQSLTTDEDTPITGSLLAVAADIDSALLQGSIVAGPQHGQVSVAADGSFTIWLMRTTTEPTALLIK